jgi:hypothetical protein
VDDRLEKDPRQDESLPTRRFQALADEQDATYPMLAPAAAAALGQEDAFDEQILAGLVNI